MLVSRLLVRGRIHRQHSALWSKRYISRKNGTQRRGLADEQPVLPLDAVIKRLTPATAVSWPALPERKDAQVLVREIRACIVANNIVAAMAILRDVPQPYPRLVAHAAVHALLRVGDPHRAGAFLLSFAIGPKTTKARPPRIHPTTLSETVKALITLVPATQGRQDRVRTAQGPQLLVLDAYMVSDPALRTALALYLQARKLFVPRSKSITGPIWNALLNHREWIPAALMLDLQVKDFQLRKTIPTLLHTPDPAAPRLTPHDRDHLGRRLDILRREDMRVNHTFFTDLCFRISGVISSLLSRPESGLMSPALIEVLKKPNTSKRFPDNDRENGRFVRSGGPPAKTPLTPTRAKHHVRVALQALAFLGALVDSRSLPFGDISAWIRTVGSVSVFYAHRPIPC
ncbi:hypothetical protein B0H13DRAFT_824719 [Mycena leptocephala]|nr:hypothetical protein B0H13DRAFT_824719 [Mycena leptocephala]